jgi:sulfonate transport system ATP-binding protein
MNTAVPLYIQHLTKVYQTPNSCIEALHDISFSVNPGEFISIVGSSGCGKSTLLRLIVGLENNFQGDILLGKDIIKGTDVNRGMVFQEARLFPWLTVEQNIAFGLVNKYTKKEKKDIVETQIALVGLKGFSQSYPYQLSGGMQQRVSIARALVNNPKILTLDEPFGALDALTRLQMQREILRIWEQEKTTMLLVTHDVDEAIYLADRVIILSNRPGMIKKIIHVDLSRPRDRNSYDFTAIKKTIYKELFDQDSVFLDYTI